MELLPTPTRSVTRRDPGYPEPLAGAFDAPETLHVRGVIPPLRPAVAIVGARAATGHGMARARELARDLAAGGALILSGGAVGIDAAAHAGALEAGAPTVAVLATGLDAPYPARHRPLFDEIVRRGGALVTPFQPRVPVRRWHFPRRNRVLAALADAVVIVEAAAGSGSLYTARAARDYGRVVAAFPGTAGAEALLAQGAAVVERAADVLAALAGSPRAPLAELPPAGSDEARVLAALDGGRPRDAGALAATSGIAPARLARALLALELDGLAVPVPGGRHLRSALADRLLTS
jgi:DNA processing protein